MDSNMNSIYDLSRELEEDLENMNDDDSDDNDDNDNWGKMTLTQYHGQPLESNSHTTRVEDNCDEWEELLQSTIVATNRLDEFESSVSLRLNRDVVERHDDHLLIMSALANNVINISFPERGSNNVNCSSDDFEIIQDLMEMMIEAVECSARIFVSTAEVEPILVDLLHLPQIHIDTEDPQCHVDENYVNANECFNIHFRTMHILQEGNKKSNVIEEIEEEMRLQEEEKERETCMRIQAVQQRQQRLVSIEEKILAIKRNKSSVRIQAIFRGKIQRQQFRSSRDMYREELRSAAVEKQIKDDEVRMKENLVNERELESEEQLIMTKEDIFSEENRIFLKSLVEIALMINEDSLSNIVEIQRKACLSSLVEEITSHSGVELLQNVSQDSIPRSFCSINSDLNESDDILTTLDQMSPSNTQGEIIEHPAIVCEENPVLFSNVVLFDKQRSSVSAAEPVCNVVVCDEEQSFLSAEQPALSKALSLSVHTSCIHSLSCGRVGGRDGNFYAENDSTNNMKPAEESSLLKMSENLGNRDENLNLAGKFGSKDSFDDYSENEMDDEINDAFRGLSDPIIQHNCNDIGDRAVVDIALPEFIRFDWDILAPKLTDLGIYWFEIAFHSTNSAKYLMQFTQRQCPNVPLVGTPKILHFQEMTPPLLASLTSWQKSKLSILSSRTFTSKDKSENMNDFNARIALVPQVICENEEEIIRSLGLRSDPTNVESIELSVEKLTDISFLRRYRHLIRLNLNVNKLSSIDIENNHGLKAMTCLSDLSLKDNLLSSISGLCDVPSLKYLYLDSNHLSDLTSVTNLSNLIVLTVNTNRINAMPSFNNPILQRLELYNNHITDLRDHSLVSLSSLMHLDIGRNRLKHVSGEALACCQLLHTLVLSQNKLTEVPSPLRLPHLRVLWLSRNCLQSLNGWLPSLINIESSSQQSLSDGAARSLNTNFAEWPLFAPMLEKLYLQDNSLSSIHPETFVPLSMLSDLDISFNNISSVSTLEFLSPLLMLKTLHIQDNPVSIPSLSIYPTIEVARKEFALFIQAMCPHLTILSGNPLTSSKISDLEETKSARELQQISAHVLSEFKTTGIWRSADTIRSIGQEVFSLKTRHNMHASRYQSPDSYEKLIAQRFNALCGSSSSKGSHIWFNLLGMSAEFVHLIGALSLQQNELRLREKHERLWIAQQQQQQQQHHHHHQHQRGLSECSDTRVKNPLTLDQAFWDAAVPDLLSKHSDIMQHWCTKKNDKDNTRRSSSRIHDDIVDIDDDCDERAHFVSFHERNRMKEEWIMNKQHKVSLDDGEIAVLSGTKINDDILFGVRKLQGLFRGYFVRKKIHAALESIHYHDDELDEMMSMMLDGPDPLDEYLQSPLELREDWLMPASSMKQECRLLSTSSSMVYGDHRSRRRTPSSASRSRVSMQDTSSEVFQQLNRPSDMECESHEKYEKYQNNSGCDNTLYLPISSRPSSSMTATSSNTISSDVHSFNIIEGSNYNRSSIQSPSALSDLSARSESSNYAESNMSNSSSRLRSTVVDEWGISDPKLLATLMRRNKRLSDFTNAKEKREKDKDPIARYQKFSRNAKGNTNSSGSFGGKPHVSRSKPKHSKAKVPAWMTQFEDDGANEDD